MGPPIKQKLADAVNKMMYKKMPEEKLKSKLSVMCPENCTLVKTSKINPAIWSKLKTPERSNDIRKQKLQTPVLKAVLPILNIANDLLKVKDKEITVQELDIKHLATQATDAITLLSHANTELNHRRRDMLRPYLNKQFQQLCSPQTPMSTFLFGDNLPETIKSMSITNSIGKQVTNTYTHQRPAPYHKPSTSYQSTTYAGNRPHGNQPRGRGSIDRGRPNHNKRRGWKQ